MHNILLKIHLGNKINCVEIVVSWEALHNCLKDFVPREIYEDRTGTVVQLRSFWTISTLPLYGQGFNPTSLQEPMQ